MANSDTIYVLPHPEVGDRVAFWDQDPLQPNGEVFITGTQTEPVAVVQTSRVLKAMEQKRLVQVDAPGTMAKGTTATSGGKG